MILYILIYNITSLLEQLLRNFVINFEVIMRTKELYRRIRKENQNNLKLHLCL